MSLRGSIGDFTVPDLLQIPLIGSLTGALNFTSEEREARVFYEKGAIVHAEAGTTQGEQVVYDLLEWTKGQFDFEKGRKSPVVTVNKDVQHLLLEGLRRLDERAKAEAELRHSIRSQLGDPSTASSLLRETMESASMVISGACLWDWDGNVLASWPKPMPEGSPEGERLAACLKVWKGSRRGWDQLYLSTPAGWAAAWNIEPLCLFAAIAGERAGLGQLHFAFRKAAEAIAQRVRGASSTA